MSQIAQQDHLLIDCGTSFSEPSDEAKTKLRKAYLRGTLNDVVLYAKNEQVHLATKIIFYAAETTGDEKILTVAAYGGREIFANIDCGAFQPEDYTDDVPYDGE